MNVKSEYSLGPSQRLPRSVKFRCHLEAGEHGEVETLAAIGRNQEGSRSLVLQRVSAAAGETAESVKTVL